MNRQDAEKIITEYVKPIFGFTLKRCGNIHDAEDLSQEIVLKAFRALLQKDDIADTEKFIWTVAHNALANYYREKTGKAKNVSIHGMEELLTDENAVFRMDDGEETTDRLQHEIAYLSKLQRRIVIAYYYENKKQGEIAELLGIPLGTVKWHLFEAKKELKRGMTTVRKTGDLKFNPIEFTMVGTNGSPGTKGPNHNFSRSALSQNIAYAVRCEYKTVNEIAEELGVSPVYVESEAEFLEQYGFLLKNGEKYIANMLIHEPTSELIRMCDNMYSRAAALFANELYDELIRSGILDDPDIYGCTTEQPTMTENGKRDYNYMLWSLIPYIAAISGEKQFSEEETVTFEEAATLRPDGGHNICSASVKASAAKRCKYQDSMDKFCGIFWDKRDDLYLFQIDTEWSDARIKEDYHYTTPRDLDLLSRLDDLSEDEEACSYLAERGYLSVCRDGGYVKISPRVIWLGNRRIRDALLSFGDRIKAKYRSELDRMKGEYIAAVMKDTPKHLKKMQRFGLQYIFFSDGWFILHCLKVLVENGKLKEPKDEQRKSLTMLLVSEE